MYEKDLQNNIIELARLLGWRHYHTYDSRRSPHGFPDLVLVRRGRLIFAELKSDTGRLTADQEAWRAALCDVERLSNGIVRMYVWRPEYWKSGLVEEALR